jgi:hypothetical protein
MTDEYPVNNPASTIDDLNLQIRAYNVLRREGITRVDQLVNMTESDLLNCRNMGLKAMENIKEQLSKAGHIIKYTSINYEGDVVHEQVHVYHCGNVTLTIAANGIIDISQSNFMPLEFVHLRRIISRLEEGKSEEPDDQKDSKHG